MPFSGDAGDMRSMELISKIENVIVEFCRKRNIPETEIPQLLDCNALNRIVRKLGLNVKVEPSSPLPTGLEVILRGLPPVVL